MNWFHISPESDTLQAVYASGRGEAIRKPRHPNALDRTVHSILPAYALRGSRMLVGRRGRGQVAAPRQSTAIDCLQRPLVPRSCFRQRLSASAAMICIAIDCANGTPCQQRMPRVGCIISSLHHSVLNLQEV